MSQKYEKLKTLLMELFQLDQPDLDFGLYRIMHAKSGEVMQFLDRDLLPQVKEAFGLYKTADKAELEKELAKVTAGVEAAGLNPDDSPKVKELRTKLANDAVDVGALENEVYDHLYGFFRRYYSEGDFLAKRVYKPGVYAIPYEGEEVKLHWANRDQYYIKTSEYLRDYAFRLRPGDDNKPMRVHFRLRDAVEGEHGNVKAVEGKDRVFILAAQDFIQLLSLSPLAGEGRGEGNELVIHFEYRPATLTDWPEDTREGKTKPPAQKDLITIATKRILSFPPSPLGGEGQGEGTTDFSIGTWIAELAKPHITTSGEKADYTRLEAHLRRYTARNTFDYFIHKDLGTFLRRELDFFIKNEVMHLDDVENETAPRVEQYLSKIKVIRRIAGKIIDFLAQLEDFQKKLWLKKKFVVETNYCITLDRIPQEFYPEIAANDAQREEWVRLFAIDKINGDLATPGYSVPLKLDFLKANPTLVVDTRHFDGAFTVQLIEAMGDLDEQTTGLLVNGDNFQALRLLLGTVWGGVHCVCIDPPYNTGSDGFCYKDNYKSSTWLCQQHQTLQPARELLTDTGSLFTFSDENEAHEYAPLLSEIFGQSNLVETLIWNKRVPKNDKGIGNIHDFVFLLSKNFVERRGRGQSYQMRKDELDDIYELVKRLRAQGKSLSETQDELKKYYRKQGYDRGITLYCELDTGFRIWGKINMSWPNPKTEGPRYEVLNPVTAKAVPIPKNGWRWKEETFRKAESDGQCHKLPDGSMMKGRIWYAKDDKTQPSSITYLDEVQSFLLRSILSVKSDGSLALENLGLGGLIDYPKPVLLLERLLHAVEEKNGVFLDYFAGSGTTGHAIINLNRQDGGVRKHIAVELGGYFDKVLLPRIKKVTFTPEWKDGKPLRLATKEEAERSPRIIKVIRLGSYEDALNNLETRRAAAQRTLLDSPQARGADGLKEQYLLRYMLDVETRGSQSLLNVQAFKDPTAYKLKVKRPGSDESREANVDLLETFNWLIGLTVRHIAAPQTFTAEFERDSEKRLRLKGRLKQIPPHPAPLPAGGAREEKVWWFRTVSGTMPDGRRTLVIWRKLTGEPEQDNLVLDEWFTKQGYSTKDYEFEIIYVNGDNNLENLKIPEDTWKVRLIEEDFHRLMFDTEGG